ncbi:unnamed protein product [Ilex paraguariensis]|uniref:RRM domain-containing protein n=1 Tax=Ilex paraguariensis TaxID=185542 RepID=A0ABC8T8G9_9AQUA
MAKKRKVRPSETQQQPDPLQQQEQLPSVEEQVEDEQAQTVEEQEELAQTHQEDLKQEQPTEEKETESMEEDEGDEENQEQDDTADASTSLNDATSAEQAPQPEVNGGGEKEEENDGEEEEEEEEEEDVEDEPVEKLLEPFSKEQLVVLVKEAVSKYPELVESVEKLADLDPAHRKIFVHGLGWDTTAETLTSVFGKYGEIEDCKAVTDKVSGKSKGYGFILFKHRSGARKALRQPQKKIGNRMTSCQLASAGPVPAPPPTAPPVSEYTQRKIFVSNVSADLEPLKLSEFFSKFGEIEDGPLGLDKQTGKPRGFALFVYKTIESARKALEEPHKTFEGHTLHVQKAIDGPKPNKQNYYQQQHQHQHHQQQHGQYHHHAAKKGKYSSGGGSGPGHLMAPSGPPAVGFNPAVGAPALAPALGQALTAFLATQGAGLGISNLLGGLGAPVNQGVPPVMNNAAGYGNQGGGGYGSQPGMQGGYQNPQMGQGSGRPPQGSAPYMGHGH